MLALASLLVVVFVSLLVTRIATVALIATGLSRESARFQARSALTGTGFTTTESESIVNHPVRRRITLWLMLLGNAGVVTAVASLMLTFAGAKTESVALRLGIVVFGLAVLLVFARSRWVDRRLSHLIARALSRWTRLGVADYLNLLHLGGDYGVAELPVEPGDWLADRTLAETGLREEGALVLGIERVGGRYLGAPTARARIRPGDTLVLYGRASLLEELDNRSWAEGDLAHQRAVAEHKRHELEERVEAA